MEYQLSGAEIIYKSFFYSGIRDLKNGQSGFRYCLFFSKKIQY